jgi:serine/threonine protein phosphatase PrpC
MEDQYFAAYPWEGDNNRALICIFDGHAGPKCAMAAKDVFPQVCFYIK